MAMLSNRHHTLSSKPNRRNKKRSQGCVFLLALFHVKHD
ncbi:hypothetical protein D018_4776 [Vibrio parahaemolyticus VP2007-007]|nr:hypothetical protein D052_4608 [Vibrio parahaemolyticus 10290]EVT80613.1 hypothetical protein D018_4776 [Vibrio parahaemolyticus VP2007-007]